MPELLDIGDGRVARMDADGVDVRILALAGPGVQSFDPDTAVSLARVVNDRLGEAVRAHPTRLAGLATMAPQAAEASAAELERAVGTLGLRGAMINGHTHGIYLDDPSVLPIFEAPEALDVPVYIHPREPSALLAAAAVPGFNVSWGYGVEAGTNVVRLMAAGVFDRYPHLRVVVGHLGEAIHFLLDRMDNRYAWESAVFGLSNLERRPSEYVKQNLFVTSSGMNYAAPMAAALMTLGFDFIHVPFPLMKVPFPLMKVGDLDALIADFKKQGSEDVFAADSLDELAAQTGIDRDGLLRTVVEYNDACARGYDPLFAKDHRFLGPLLSPPYYAARHLPGAYGSLGGIKIDHRTQVLDKERRPIPGLYAAGTDANSIYGDGYVFVLPGNTMGFAVNSGRIAGDQAAEYVRRMKG